MTYTIETARAALATSAATIQAIADATGWPIIEDCLDPEPNTWHADDGNAEITVQCDTGEEAAQEYVDGGEWGEIESTTWITVRVWREGIDEDGDTCIIDDERRKITIEPDVPECRDGEDHEWESPYEIVGGCKENPGVWGSGGGVKIHEVCMRCGCEKVTDTWAQDPSDGEQGLTSVSYEPEKYADEVSAAMRERVEFSVEHALDSGKALIIARVDSLSATYEVYDPEQWDEGDGYSYADSDTWPLNGEWPDPPQRLIDEARELAEAWEGITPASN